MGTEKEVLLTMRHIDKHFPGVTALSDVSFTLHKGEIHALMGENGAGKSTLIKVLTGVEEFEQGAITISGRKGTMINHSPQEAQANGISTVYQEVNLCANLSVGENIFIGREPKKRGMIDWKTIYKKSEELLQSLDIHIDVTKSLDHYSIALQQMVAIARAVDISAKVLILDEPTSSLDESEVKNLFKLMRTLREKGMGIVFVTHFLEQVYAVCDRITVLRNGEWVGDYDIDHLPRLQLVAKMMGKEFDDLASIKQRDHQMIRREEASIVKATEVGHTGSIQPYSLEVHAHEVVGLAGLLGSGRSELARTLYGADKPDSGTIEFKGAPIAIHAPIDAIKAGMGYLPENRKEEGIFPDLSVRENIMIALQVRRGMWRLYSRKEQEAFTDQYIDLLQIKTAHRDIPIKQLSGGNQQKVILGRWLLTDPDFLILDEPTRGIDVGTKTEIQKLVIELSEQGKGVLFISSEIEEMLRTCSKMLVLRDREVVGKLYDKEMSQESIMTMIAGGGLNG